MIILRTVAGPAEPRKQFLLILGTGGLEAVISVVEVDSPRRPGDLAIIIIVFSSVIQLLVSDMRVITLWVPRLRVGNCPSYALFGETG